MDHLDGLTWRTSSYSGSNGGNCIEITVVQGIVAVRDSRDSQGPVLAFGAGVWQRFAEQVKTDVG